jgi:hypothetical protein
MNMMTPKNMDDAYDGLVGIDPNLTIEFLDDLSAVRQKMQNEFFQHLRLVLSTSERCSLCGGILPHKEQV